MPTKHKRIAITADPEVKRALADARRENRGARGADASLARELLLKGAERLRAEAQEEESWSDRMVREYGARRATGRFGDSIRKFGPLPKPPAGSITIDEALAEQRRSSSDRIGDDSRT